MTDTNSGISVEQGEKLGIFVLPMPIIVEGRTFLEGEGLNAEEYYTYLEEDKDSSTSQPSPESFINRWEKIFSLGYDEIVYIPMSGGLSGSYATAASFAEEYKGRVQVVNNYRISVTLMDSVLDAKELAAKGLNSIEIKEILEKTAYDQSIYITVTTLKRLIKSGRVTAAGAAVATALSIKPILQTKGEKLDAFAKARSLKKAASIMIDALKNDIKTKFKNIPVDELRVRVAGTLTNRNEIDRWRQEVQTAFPEFEIEYFALPCSIASHLGANAIGIAIDKIVRL